MSKPLLSLCLLATLVAAIPFAVAADAKSEPKIATDALATAPGLRLNESEYLEMPGLNVMLAHDYYPESHQGGVGFIQNGLRVATNGDLRLETVPGQWAPVPAVGKRQVDRATGTVSVRMSYPDTSKDRRGFNPIEYPDLALSYTLRIVPEGRSFLMVVDLDAPLPQAWVGRVGLNLELFPGLLFGKSYSGNGYNGVFARQVDGPLSPGPDGVEAAPLASGPSLVIAGEEPRQTLRVESLTGGTLELLDGRVRHTNGWFVLRALVPAGATRAAVSWRVTPTALPGWLSEPVVQVSQVGYHPREPKIAVIELDRADTRRPTVQLLRTREDGSGFEEVLNVAPADWGPFLRYHYLHFDFSSVRRPGVYVVRFGQKQTAPFVISESVYARGVWQPTVEYFLPVQMCHMRVSDRYRVWHGDCHASDALMAPVNHNHFDGYLQGPSTLTRFAPGEAVPNLAVGGWHDAGDFDLRVESQADTIHGLALAWEQFRPELDSTTIDQSTRRVEIHRPDGRPDLLQQIEHGALTIVAGHRALGRLYRGIIEPSLREYTLLGDPAVALEPRWVFTEENPRRELQVAAGLAASARALATYNKPLADECRELAVALWDKATPAKELPVAFRLSAAVELLQTTGDRRYAEYCLAHARDLADSEHLRHYAGTLARSIALVGDNTYSQTVRTGLLRLRETLEVQAKATPYGVPYQPDIWGAGWGIQRFGVELYTLHQACPDLFPAEGVHRALQFILGCHPGPNTASFVTGVGARSVTTAYGMNRGDAGGIPGGIVSGTALIRPDYPELLEWPFLWQQTEYCLGSSTSDYVLLVLAAERLLTKR